MHRFPNKSVITLLRFGALLFILRCLLIAIGLPLLLVSMLLDIQGWFFTAVGMLVFFPIVILVQCMVAAKARCPLCFAQPLMHRGCVKSHKARKLLMSYRLQVAVSSLLQGYFRCPYCGEPAEMKARERTPMEER